MYFDLLLLRDKVARRHVGGTFPGQGHPPADEDLVWSQERRRGTGESRTLRTGMGFCSQFPPVSRIGIQSLGAMIQLLDLDLDLT